MIELLTVIYTVVAVVSLAMDSLLFYWHRRDKRRLAADEARLDADEKILNEKHCQLGRNPHLDWRYADEDYSRCP